MSSDPEGERPRSGPPSSTTQIMVLVLFATALAILAFAAASVVLVGH